VLAVLGIMVPVSQASAASWGIAPQDDAVEVIGATVAYDFTCHNDGVLGQPHWLLLGPDVVGWTPITDYQQGEFDETTGTFAVSYADRTPGDYTLYVECGWFSNTYRSFTLATGKDATTTTLTTSSDLVVLGDSVDLTATVTGAGSGEVTFYADGTPFATQPLVDGTASTTRVVSSAQTLTAGFAETETAQGSSSSAKVVGVISEITAPQGVGISTWVAVGAPQSVDVGEWAPSGVELSYSWKVADREVGTDPTYVPVPADQGKELTVTVTGTRAPLAPVSRTSPAAVVALGSIQQGSIELDGLDGRTAVLGQTITPRPVGYGSDASFSYQWYVGDNEFSVPGASYTPTGADLGKTIRLHAWVTAPGKQTVQGGASAWPAVATPTVTVGSSTITVGRDAVVPVTVTGPQGAPVPAGSVVVTAVPQAGGDPVVLDPVALDGSGAAAVTVSSLAVGTWDTTVAYVPTPGSSHHYAVTAVDLITNPYTEASGTGTVTVTKVTPTVKLAGTVTVPVATPAVVDVTVGGVRLPTTYVFREGGTVLGQGELAADGAIGAVLPVLTPGDHRVTLEVAATAESFAASRSFTVVVDGEPARSGALPTAHLETPEAATAPGQQMELVAAGFEPGETVAFYLHSDPVFLGTAVADANGVARLLADIPADVPAGEHTVIATGGTSGRWATLAVELAVPAATPTATTPAAAGPAAAATPAAAAEDLAVTGAQSGMLVTGAWLMLLLGGGLVLVARRVRATR